MDTNTDNDTDKGDALVGKTVWTLTYVTSEDPPFITSSAFSTFDKVLDAVESDMRERGCEKDCQRVKAGLDADLYFHDDYVLNGDRISVEQCQIW